MLNISQTQIQSNFDLNFDIFIACIGIYSKLILIMLNGCRSCISSYKLKVKVMYLFEPYEMV